MLFTSESIEKDAGANGNDTAEDAVGAEDIFGDDLSIRYVSFWAKCLWCCDFYKSWEANTD